MFKKVLKNLWKAEEVLKAPYRPLVKTMAFWRHSPAMMGPSVFKFFNVSDNGKVPFFNFGLVDKSFNCQRRFVSTDNDSTWQTVLKRLRDNDASLTSLDFGSNVFYAQEIGDVDAQALGEVLKVNQTLRSLRISGHKISDTGAQALAESLKINGTLQTLFLDHGYIGDRGAIDLAKALVNNRALIKLDLTHNEITDVGAKAFVTTLINNYTLIRFWLRWAFSPGPKWPITEQDENISDKVENEIDALIERNSKLADAMYEAVKKGDITTVNRLVQQGVSLLLDRDYYYSDQYNTLLHYAVIAKQSQMTAHLLQLMQEQGLPLNTRNKDNKAAADLAQGTELEALFQLQQDESSKPLFIPGD